MKKKLRLLATGALAVGALAVPGTAGAASEGFCGGAWLESGWDCHAGNVRTLQSVEGWVWTSGSHRVCAASASWYGGPLNSDWRCDYSVVVKVLNGRVDGVGAVHNGAPYGWQLWTGVQYW
jgi:hypothetical protein